MKISEKLKDLDWNNPIEHLVALAYLSGQEAATKEICDEHSRRMGAMRNAANNCRYHKMANSIINIFNRNGQMLNDIIYSPHYAGDVTAELCDNEWPL